MAIRAWKAELSYRLRRVAALMPGFGFERYVIVAVPLAGLRGATGAGVIAPERAVAADLASAEAARWRAAQGMICLGVERGDALTGVTWLTRQGFDEDEAWLRFEPPPGAAWDTGMMILAHARGGRAFQALWSATRAWGQPLGIHWSISRIADYNLASRRAHARLGGVEIGRVTMVRVGTRQWAMGASPRFARVGGARPVVRPMLPA